jgi:hypothetical protein
MHLSRLNPVLPACPQVAIPSAVWFIRRWHSDSLRIPFTGTEILNDKRVFSTRTSAFTG